MKRIKSKKQDGVFDGELIVFDEPGSLQKYDDSVANKLTVSSFLPRLQLMTGNSEKCKKGEFGVNKFALINGQDHKDVGDSVDVLVLVWRPKAIDSSGDELIVIHDIENPEFERIQQASGEKDSGCMFGQEFLVWISETREFATFFMGTKTSRRESPNLKALLQKAATLKPVEVKNKKYTWYSPSVTKCSTTFDLPSKEECIEQIKEFNNPSVQEIERVEEEAKSEVRG